MIEFRSIEIRNDNLIKSGSRKISGLAIPVESPSQLLGGQFYETISRDAVNEALITSNDVRLLYNHESSHGTLGRSKFGEGTLLLSIEDDGLHFECELPDTDFGNSIYSGLTRGEIDAVSFGFYVGDDEWSENNDGTYNRTIKSIEKLVEISLLDVLPAYDATNVNLRSLEDYKEEKDKEHQIMEMLNMKLQEINDLIERD